LHNQRYKFNLLIEPHLRAAYNLARWLMGNHADAEDVAQESLLKAFRAVDRVHAAEEARAWLLAIVRNTALNYMQRRRPKAEVSSGETLPDPVDHSVGPEVSLLQQERRDKVRRAIQHLPLEFREPIILREIESLSYKEIAWVLKIPIGTVMSRLSRARVMLMNELIPKEKCHDVSGN
jgi:RNA polymerase sigma-70 factor (ECF subfamily)